MKDRDEPHNFRTQKNLGALGVLAVQTKLLPPCVVGFAAIMSCSDSERVCPMIGVPSPLTVRVKDAVTDNSICDASVVVTVAGKLAIVFQESPADCPYKVMNGPSHATYVVEVAAPGYQSSPPESVFVPREEECGYAVHQERTIRLAK